VAEEAVTATVVAPTRRAAGLDELGHEAVAVGEAPAAQQGDKSQEAGPGNSREATLVRLAGLTMQSL
jgi:hypothetical protein